MTGFSRTGRTAGRARAGQIEQIGRAGQAGRAGRVRAGVWLAGLLGLAELAGLLCLMVGGATLGPVALGQTVSTTTVQGTVYLANGQPGSGTLLVSWPAFTTAGNEAVAAGRQAVTIGLDGFVSVNLAPNLGATPAGLYYTAVYHLSDGSVNTEYWVIPSATTATIAAVRAQVLPAAQAVQAVSKSYVDAAIAGLEGSLLTANGGTLTGPLILAGDPTTPLMAADKHYVDSVAGGGLGSTGGNILGPLNAVSVDGVFAPVAGSSQTNLQTTQAAAVVDGGLGGPAGAMLVPPTYAGTDTFTNTQGIRVEDLRAAGAQQHERSVKEFGAVCDGVTDDTAALQAALNFALSRYGAGMPVSVTLPAGICKTHQLVWHLESIGGQGRQVSGLMGFPGEDVLATATDAPSLLPNTHLHDFAIYVDQSVDVSCSGAAGRNSAGSCGVNRPMEPNSVFSAGGNGLAGTPGSGAGWAIGNCAIAMPAALGTGGNGLRQASLENLAIATVGVDPLGQYPGVDSTHTCGMYLAQWPVNSEFRGIDIRGVGTGIAIPNLPGTVPAGLVADSNRFVGVSIEAVHGFAAAVGTNGVLDGVEVSAGNSAAAGESPTGIVLDFAGLQTGWTVRNATVAPVWNAVAPKLTVNATGGAVTSVSVGPEHGLGFEGYGVALPLAFSGSCTATGTVGVNSDGSLGGVAVTSGGFGCSGTTVATVNNVGLGLANGADIWPGDALLLTAPSLPIAGGGGLNAQVVVRQVTLEYGASLPDLVGYGIEFSNDWANDLSVKTSKTVPADTWLPAAISPTYLASLNGLAVTAITAGAVSVAANAVPPTGGGFEVRRRDFAFGLSAASGSDVDLVLRSSVANFDIPRATEHDRFYVRMYDAATPANYSEFSVGLFVNLPLS